MTHIPWPVIAVAAIAIIAVGLLKALLGGKKAGTDAYPYEKQPTLFTPAEHQFLQALEQAVDDRLRIMGKIRLADIVKVKSNTPARQKAFNRIQGKHVDFVACNPETYSVEFVIELDDKSHNQSDRQRRDVFLDNALAAAQIPIYRFPVKRTYSTQDLHNVLFHGKPQGIGNEKTTTCPECGGQLIERIAKKGTSAGQTFLGCSNYPRCRYAVNIPR